MAKTILRFALMYVVLMLAQAVLFNRICLFGYAVPLVFVYFIASLPVTLSVNWVLTLGFLSGLTVDIFSDTPGVNALACTLLAGSRGTLIRLYVPREEDFTNPEPSVKSMGPGNYAKYLLTVSIVYCTLFFLIDAFTFFNPLRLVIRIVASTALTFTVMLAINSLTTRNEKRL
ncbi:MAG: rod shape-determining protein MreD [Muribaculaceae bacterium]|nr:rod shape-determining protein MreD [Muribaculaceae bacterium]